jgi:hypothetical protein
MSQEIKIILAIIIGITFFWNLSVITWTNTPSDDSSIKQELACIQGGGKASHGGIGNYLSCTKS